MTCPPAVRGGTRFAGALLALLALPARAQVPLGPDRIGGATETEVDSLSGWFVGLRPSVAVANAGESLEDLTRGLGGTVLGGVHLDRRITIALLASRVVYTDRLSEEDADALEAELELLWSGGWAGMRLGAGLRFGISALDREIFRRRNVGGTAGPVVVASRPVGDGLEVEFAAGMRWYSARRPVLESDALPDPVGYVVGRQLVIGVGLHWTFGDRF